MLLTIFGASGPTGGRVVDQALAAGHHVRAVTRRPDAYRTDGPGVDVIRADVNDLEGVRLAVSGTDAVISTFGVPYSRHRITVYSQGITNIVQAMVSHHVERLVCVSSTTVATVAGPGESLVWRKMVKPVLRNLVGRTLYDDMQRMEHIVEISGLDWTIVRPGGLFNTAAPTGDYQVAAGRLPGRVTSRADLAELLVQEATQPRFSGSTIEVITRSQTPSTTTFLNDAFGRKP